MEVERTAHIGVAINARALLLCGHDEIEVVGEDGSDTFGVERADREGIGRHAFGTGLLKAFVEPQHAHAGAEALLRMRATGQNGDDQPLGVRADLGGPALKAFGRPLGIVPMGRWHMFNLGPVAPGATISPLMRSDPLPFVEELDRACGDAGIDLLADQRMGNGVVEAFDLDMIIEPDADQFPLGIFIICRRQGPERRPIQGLQQIRATDAELAHRPGVHLRHHHGNGGVRLVQ